MGGSGDRRSRRPALAALYRGRIPPEFAMGGVDPATRMLAAMQTVAPKLLDAVSLAIDIDTADAELLKLALVVLGLNRDIQHLLHPRHDNGAIVRALGQHDDPIVRQYSVWAVIENTRLGVEYLGIPFDGINGSRLMCRRSSFSSLPKRSQIQSRQQDLIIAGTNLPSVEAREGLAMGLAHSFYDGLQDVTIPWARTESDDRVLLPLAEHFARHAGEAPSYRDEALRPLRPRGGVSGAGALGRGGHDILCHGSERRGSNAGPLRRRD